MDLIPAEQRRYARWLSVGAAVGFTLLVVGFAIYASGAVSAHVPIERLPQLWGLSSAEYLRRTGTPAGWGWGWLVLAGRADTMNLVGIAVLTSCSLPCLLAAAASYHARRDRALAAISLLSAAILLLAATGVLAPAGH